ncbi:MAG: peptidoglycan bridge formation glycyltransferase FemA/FemB family protein, partial [Desulfobacterales bacterium]|nr:peptidoglycan bridge formation glycyltransferase FemA/FemB family protein [Desulfobacterales bacterium]
MSLQIINPLTCPGWDEQLSANPESSFFHTSAWAKVLCESYGYQPVYFASMDNGQVENLIPVMEINSFLTGKRGVALPFTDFCPPIISTRENFQKIVNHVVPHGKISGWKSLEIRGGDSGVPYSTFYTHILNLKKNPGDIFSNFKNSTQRNIKKAEKQGIRVDFSGTFKSTKSYYQLHCKTRQHHGLPPQPFHFFKNIYEHILSQ